MNEELPDSDFLRAVARAHPDLAARLNDIADEIDIAYRLANSQSALLTGAVNALRGQPPEDTLWSHHDVADLAQRVVADRDRLVNALGQIGTFALKSRVAP